MKQVNTVEIDDFDRDLSYSKCRSIFGCDGIIWDGDDKIGWQTYDKEKIRQYYNKSEKFRDFLKEIKQDVSWIDKIIVMYD